MKSEQLKKLIKEVVRKEIKQQVTSEVNKALSTIVAELIKNKSDRQPVVSPPVVETPVVAEEIQESVSPPPQPPTTPRKTINTGNPALDAILAETSGHGAAKIAPGEGSMASLMEGGFDRVGTEEEVVTSPPSGPKPTKPETKIDYLKNMVTAGAPPAKPSITETAAVPDVLKGVFKKDFRQLMKAIDEKAKNGGSGMINPSQITGG